MISRLPRWERKNNILALFFLSLALAAGLRIYHLGHASLWLDEIATVYGQDIINPPAYPFLIKTWIAFFGSGETALRFPSMIFSLLGVPILFLFGKKLFSVRAGLIAALLLAVSPYSINYAQEARMYSLLGLLCLVSFYAFYRFIRDDSRFFLAVCLLANTASIYVSYSGGLIILAESFILISSFFKWRLLKAWMINQVILLVLISPILPIFLAKVSNPVGISWISLSFDYRDLFRGIFSYLSGDLSGRASPLAYLPLICLIGLGYFRFGRGRPRWDFSREDFLLGAWFFSPL